MKRMIALTLCFVLLCSLAGCKEPVEEAPRMDTTGKYQLDEIRNEAIITDTGMPSGTVGNARVYYQIFVGSFSDSDGDGTGDLRGIINRMDYLNDGKDDSGLSLGIEGIWLTPIFLSGSYHKYDVSDYYTIDPKFGTMDDLKELIALCHERDVQIILDLVINHTSTAHPWFQAFKEAHRNNDTESEYYDFYTWSNEPLAERTWNTIPGTNQYYECNFSGEMPELNYDNDTVRKAMVDIAKFYLDLGVDGFRFDAAKYIYFADNEKSVEFWQWYMTELRKIKPDIYTVAEVWDGDANTIPYFSATNCFNFSMSQVSGRIADAARSGNVNTLMNYIDSYITSIRAQSKDAMLLSFIANHDMDRAAGYVTVDMGHAFNAASLSVLTPGSPYIYYGEEIGMLGSRGGANTDANRRLAMLWGDGDTVKNPIGSSYTAEQRNGTVADQLCNGSSLYSHYKRLIAIRKANPEIACGTFTPLELPGKQGGFLSTYNGSTVAVIHNTTTETASIDLSHIPNVSLTKLAAIAGLGTATLDGSILTLEPNTSVVLR